MTVLRSGSATDVGRVRHSNQDRLLEEPNLFAVADGMGGHVGGEVAAQVAVDALRVSFARQATVDGLRRAVGEANAAVWREGQEQADLRGMGTTMTAVALVAGADGRDVIALANVGDSRAYVFSGGRAVQVTSDHSLAEEKVRQGELTEAEAAVHPHRHILTRALGVSLDVDVDLWELRLHDGDRILLCSDGLTNEVGTEQIAGTLASTAEPAEAARALVEAAVAHGGNDNVTVLVVDVLVADPDAAPAPDPVPDAPAAADGLAPAGAAGAAG
ncbi:MAG TPA: Stp1/IreP family PP2C-type Ser/Thr phosphatase, partial [Acidimicrobiales bacterium]